MPVCFQLLPVSPRGTNPHCLVPSKSIAASQSPAKSSLVLSRAVPQISPVAGFRTLSLPRCLACPLPFSSLAPCCADTLPWFLGTRWPGGLLPLAPILASRAGLSPGEVKCRHACHSFVPVPAQLSRGGGRARPHEEGTPPPHPQPLVLLSSVFQITQGQQPPELGEPGEEER